MTEQEFVRRVELLSQRLDVRVPRVRVAHPKGRTPLFVRIVGWTIQTTDRTLAELTDLEIEFGLALAMSKRLEPSQRSPHWIVAPFAALTFIGTTIIYFKRDDLLENFWLGFGILFTMMVLGYIAGMLISVWQQERARTHIIKQALNLTGNASAAQSFIIRCMTDRFVSGSRRMGSTDREHLTEELDSLASAAYGLGLSYSPVAFGD